MLNLASLLTDSARRFPDKDALRLGPLATTYAELDDLSARTAALLLARGVQPGDSLAIALSEPAGVRGHLLRHLARGRRRRAAERPAQARRGRLPPEGLGGEAAVRHGGLPRRAHRGRGGGGRLLRGGPAAGRRPGGA